MKLLNYIRKALGLNPTYYKVVLNRDGQLLSAVGGPARVRYYLNQWAYPLKHNGPLCVFETLKQAAKFSTEVRCWTGNFEIWTCEIMSPVRYYSVWCYDEGIAYHEKLEELPWGTALASQVKLLKRVSSWSLRSHEWYPHETA